MNYRMQRQMVDGLYGMTLNGQRTRVNIPMPMWSERLNLYPKSDPRWWLRFRIYLQHLPKIRSEMVNPFERILSQILKDE